MRLSVLLLLILFSVTTAAAQTSATPIKYSDCPGCWNADSLGNHRVVLHFDGGGTGGRPGAGMGSEAGGERFARAVISWRRRDQDPGSKRIIVQDARTGNRVLNATTGVISRESGEVFFEPVSGKGDYYIYYMPYRNEGRSNYPKGVYWPPDMTASSQWLRGLQAAAHLAPSSGGSEGTRLPANCTVREIQSIDAFNSFYPMEVIATAAETWALRDKYKNQGFLVFPEDRQHPIRMRNDLPYRWIRKGPALEKYRAEQNGGISGDDGGRSSKG